MYVAVTAKNLSSYHSIKKVHFPFFSLANKLDAGLANLVCLPIEKKIFSTLKIVFHVLFPLLELLVMSKNVTIDIESKK